MRRQRLLEDLSCRHDHAGGMLRKGVLMRIAAIDIGTNSVRCKIAEVSAAGTRKTLYEDRAHTRLGRGLTAGKRLSEESICETVSALRGMLQSAEEYEATHVRAVATAALRNATDAETFLVRIREELGLEVDVISEEEEGRLAYLSAADSVRLERNSALVDIGGGSVEVVRTKDGRIASINSLPIGAVFLSERYHARDPMPKKDFERMIRHIRLAFFEAVGKDAGSVDQLIGSGGSVNTVAALIAARREPVTKDIHAFELGQAEVAAVLALLANSTAKSRAALEGMPRKRVDIIIEGAAVLAEAMRAFDAKELIVNARGMREGLVIDTFERQRGALEPTYFEQQVDERKTDLP